ncbi:MAG: hypothetical protein JWM98_554, partial [Thermoleophilia bacterium]|nr:hypothetical protein [Thermoleophilia bacterium]
ERGPGAGASAAPDAGAAATTTPAVTTGPTPATTTPGATPPTSGTATTSAGGPASTAASGGSTEVVAEQRELYGVRVRQSEARLANISASLRADYPAAARLASASTGWDPETFVPKTKEEAEAFAQRMVIDATESAARLEIVKTQLDSATFEAQTTGSPAATAQAAKLQADFDRQKTYVDKLARIVDTAAGGAVTDKGADAMRGRTMRNDGDIPIAEMVTALRDAGMTEGQIARTVGASELGVEQERTPGGSETLKTVAKTSADWTWANRFNLQQARRAEDRRIEAKRRERQADEDEQRQWQRNVDRNRVEKRAFTAHLETRAAERKARSDSQFQSYLQRIQAERRQARAG